MDVVIIAVAITAPIILKRRYSCIKPYPFLTQLDCRTVLLAREVGNEGKRVNHAECGSYPRNDIYIIYRICS